MINDANKKDEEIMRRCINLSQQAKDDGDGPFGCVVTKNGEILAETKNSAKDNPTQHAEILALLEASSKLKSNDLTKCTLYSNCEPCPMCSFMIREYKIGKVVFALSSPYMGGFSRWKILKDQGLSKCTPFFTVVPEVIPYLLENEAKKVFDNTGWWMFGKRYTSKIKLYTHILLKKLNFK